MLNSWVGYTGGPASGPDPTYQSVCGGDGHTEALRLEFDPSTVPFDTLIREFYEDPHVPTYPRANGRPQYMAAIWAQDEAQAVAAERIGAEVGKEVPVLPKAAWHMAEEYHQHFLGGFKDFPDDDDE